MPKEYETYIVDLDRGLVEFVGITSKPEAFRKWIKKQRPARYIGLAVHGKEVLAVRGQSKEW